MYQTLDISCREIRLVHLCLNDQKQITGSLQVVSLDHAPDFDALSYVWGDQDVTENMILDGTTVTLTTNLHAALLSLLRKRAINKPIWVDRLCVNQNDTAERSHQLHFMKHLYSSAHTVHAWLGVGPPDAQRVFDWVRVLGSTPTIFFENISICSEEVPLISFQEIFEAPWWRRVWIVQEANLAKCVCLHCGDYDTSLEDVCRATNKARSGTPVTATEQIPVLTVFMPCMRLAEMGQGRDPYLILHRGRSYMATDGKDRIYGLLGVLPEQWRIQPDYGLTVEEVYQQSTLQIMSAERSLKLLSGAQFHDDTSHLPSWAPDWRVRESDCGKNLIILQDQFDACGSARCTVRPFQSGVLEVRSLIVDELTNFCEIHATSDLIDLDQKGRETLRNVGLARAFWADREVAGSGEKDDVWRTVSFDSFGPRDSKSYPNDVEQCKELEELYADGRSLSTLTLLGLFLRCQGLRGDSYPSLTTKGRIGIITAEPKLGDTIHVLAGSRLPFVLRARPDHGPHSYQLVGTCYIYGRPRHLSGSVDAQLH